MSKKHELIKENLLHLIAVLENSRAEFVYHPDSDFTRKRKISFSDVIQTVLAFGGRSMPGELREIFADKSYVPSAQAFYQQRSKIKPSAFEALFRAFQPVADVKNDFHDYRLLAVDGSKLQIATNPQDVESYRMPSGGKKGYNQFHINACLDLDTFSYSDAVVQKLHSANECSAFVNMVDNYHDSRKTIFIADRNFASYNNMAHVQQRGQYFLFRTKDIGQKGLVDAFDLPSSEAFDKEFKPLTLIRKYDKSLLSHKNDYHFIARACAFDFLNTATKKNSGLQTFKLHFRIVRFKLDNGSLETVLTNLDALTFPPDVLKRLYCKRWGIECSFRSLKHTIGLVYLHSKIDNLCLQEIFARLTIFNFAQMILRATEIHNTVRKKKRKLKYKICFSAAVQLSKQFLLGMIKSHQLAERLFHALLPVREGKHNNRPLNHHSKMPAFNYRVI